VEPGLVRTPETCSCAPVPGGAESPWRFRSGSVKQIIRGLATAWMVLLLLCSGIPLREGTALADPTLTAVRGTEPDGSERILEDLAILWRSSGGFDGSWLAVRAVSEPEARLRAVRMGRADFAVLDSAAFADLKGEYSDVVVLSVLSPLVVHAFTRASGAQPVVPLGIAYTAPARFAAQALGEPASPLAPTGPTAATPGPGAGGPGGAAGQPLASAPPPIPQHRVDPVGAFDLLRRGLPTDELLLLAAPPGTATIDQALRGDSALRLMAWTPVQIEAAQRDRPWVFANALPRGTYASPIPAGDVPGQWLLLVTRAQLGAEDAARMLQCLYGRREQVGPYNPLFAVIDRRANGEVAKWAPYHVTAAKEFGIGPAAAAVR
jgi:hypothetical protein